MIDWNRIDELCQDVGEEDFAEVVEIFLEEVDEVTARLDASATSNLEEDLHFLKGSALNLGLSDVAKLCEVGERQARDAQADLIDLTAIVGSIKTSRTALLDGIASRFRV